MKPIAHIKTDFASKFGLPRQSGLIPEIEGKIIFEKKYRNPEAFRGLEEFSHIWLLWQFSEAVRKDWSPTVRPPLLGGNKRMGVFATRSPFRPNEIGLSSVRLVGCDLDTPDGPVLYVAGADLMDGTPILDIKPYLPYTDSHPDATGGFAPEKPQPKLSVIISDELVKKVPDGKLEALKAVLAQDPRPAYKGDSDRVYGLPFAGRDVKFKVGDGVLTVTGIE